MVDRVAEAYPLGGGCGSRPAPRSDGYSWFVEDWALWAVLAVVLGIVEVLSLTLVLGFIAVACGVAAGVALAGGGVALQLLGFAVSGAVGLVIVRPVARRHLRTPPALPSGVSALKGTSGTVLERVDVRGGRVKLGGEVWSARAWDEAAVIEPGRSVQVLEIEGATAVVYDVESRWKS